MKKALIIFMTSVMASLAASFADGRDTESLRAKWKDWKDPLSESELNALMHEHYTVAKSLVERSRQARIPMESSVKLEKPISFLGRTFGEVRPVGTNACRTVCNDTVSEHRQTYDLKYFAFDHVAEHMSPHTHRLHTLDFCYRDYAFDVDGPYPLGRYDDARDFLREGQSIIADLEQRLGAPLQKLQLMRSLWPFRPGVKMSRAWSGAIPECFLCDEDTWVASRHAVAESNTNLGRLHIRLMLHITYYDEFYITLSISDVEELARCREESENGQEVRKKE